MTPEVTRSLFPSLPCTDGSWEPAFRLNWASDRALLQMFYVALHLYWCWKTKAHLIRMEIIVRRKWGLRVMVQERIEGLIGLGFFYKDENNVN